MLHLRKSFASFAIWIDAIYINPSDEVEKTQQLQFMHPIYTLSRTTNMFE